MARITLRAAVLAATMLSPELAIAQGASGLLPDAQNAADIAKERADRIAAGAGGTGTVGPAGPAGPAGPKGDKGDTGAAAPVVVAPTVAVDALADNHPISPLIYGVNDDPVATVNGLNATINRNGGDAADTYNWSLNAANRGADYYYESLGSDGSSVAGEYIDNMVSLTEAAGGTQMITVPLLGYVAKLTSARGKYCGFPVTTGISGTGFGPQQYADTQTGPGGSHEAGDCGNGKDSSGKQLPNSVATNALVADTPAIEKGWVQHLVAKWGLSTTATGVRYYALDNEPGLWYQSHNDASPINLNGPGYVANAIAMANMIHSVDPGAQVVGPEEFGWNGVLYSPADVQTQSGSSFTQANRPDANANGFAFRTYTPWLLQQMKAAGHPLDVFSLHYYPQSGEYGGGDNATMTALRAKSTRSLWDQNYVDVSYLHTTIALIPTMKKWVSQYYYADTPTAITEYNWGDTGMSSATAQADVEGIFGREGLTIANRWTAPAAGTPVYEAMALYRNYDGGKSTFGDMSARATVANPDNLSAFAATRTGDGSLTVMVINKATTALSGGSISLANFGAGGSGLVSVYQVAAPGTSINSIGQSAYSGNSFSLAVPAQSITLYVFTHF